VGPPGGLSTGCCLQVTSALKVRQGKKGLCRLWTGAQIRWTVRVAVSMWKVAKTYVLYLGVIA